MKDINKLREMMRNGIVEFSYNKVNGELREARGTLNGEFIDLKGGTPKGSGVETEGVFRYWDVDSDGWRSCREDLIIDFK